MSQDTHCTVSSGTDQAPFTGLIPQFSTYLSGAGRSHAQIVTSLGPAEHFLAWLKLSRIPLETVEDAVLHQFLAHECACPVPPFKFNRLHNREVPHFVSGLRTFVQFLEETGRITTPGEIDDNLRLLNTFLEQRQAEGYSASSIRHCRGGSRHFLFWLHHCRISLADIDKSVFDRFSRHDCICARPGVFFGFRGHRDAAVRVPYQTRAFITFLAERGLAPKMLPLRKKPNDGLDDYREWLRQHRGTGDEAIQNHIYNLSRVLPNLGNNPRGYDAEVIRSALLHHLKNVSPAYAKNLVGAVRMYIRYLASKGECPAELVEAIPTVPHRRLSTLPKYISPDDMERVIGSFDTTTGKGRRDRTIVLLLGRLGLRARDVSNLNLSDIDWKNASLRVRSKSAIEAALPLPQDVGDALLDYILTARPRVDEEKVFLRTRPPHRPFRDGQMVSLIARDALDRAEVNPPGGGGVRVFRHSTATSLLRSGATLDVVGAVLRHRFRETTAIYAKVDTEMLLHVAQPWIGGDESCR